MSTAPWPLPGQAGPANRRWASLWGPASDALLLGGASVLAFALLRLLNITSDQLVWLGGVMMALAHLVNHPHFAHSYQIFYGRHRDVRAGRVDAEFGRRWWWAAVIAPTGLAGLLAFALWRATENDLLWMALCINLMGLLVGWHYVKQGFGMAMTDAALKRRFWPPAARQALLVNAYVCWFAAWVLINTTEAGRSYWGYFALRPDIPTALIWAAGGACVVSTIWMTVVVSRALRSMGPRTTLADLPLAGLLAYVVTLYLWTVFAWADPAYLLMIPFFHSLQYLTVVWRYKLNEWESMRGPGATGVPYREALRFLAVGIAMGAAGFWLLPVAVDALRTQQFDFSPQGPAPALACAWLFINVHHYLIDNVLWRKGNDQVDRFLFGSKPKT